MQAATMFFHVGYRRLVGAVRDEKTAMAERCKRPTHMSNLFIFEFRVNLRKNLPLFHNTLF